MLAEEKAKSDALFASIGEGLIATDERGMIVRINEAALGMLGYKEADLLGKWYPNTLISYDMKGAEFSPTQRPIARALLEGKPVSAKVQYARKNGERIPINVTVAPILYKSRPTGTIHVLRDITKEEQIDRAKTEFVSLASHQLRTPLTAIRWHLETFLSGEAGRISAEQKKSLSELYHVNLRLIDLVKALLSVARIELGTLAIEPVPTRIERLAKEVTFELRPQIAKKKLHFSEHYARDIPEMPLDPDLTRIVIQNLLTNAVKYTPHGGSVRIDIRLDGSHVLITVADTGLGVPKDQQDKLFTKLFRADNVREAEPDGTGLGLYVIKSVIEAAKGSIWFESEENKGTTFYVTLPVKGMARRVGTKGLESMEA